MLILKEVKVFCFDAVLQVLILNGLILHQNCAANARDAAQAVGLTTDLPKSRVPEKRPLVKEKELEIAGQFEFDACLSRLRKFKLTTTELKRGPGIPGPLGFSVGWTDKC